MMDPTKGAATEAPVLDELETTSATAAADDTAPAESIAPAIE